MENLSIILPCYNEDHESLRKLKSELTNLGAEVIVVDDGSDVQFPESIKHGSNYGYGAALLTAMANSSRPYVMAMDSDGQHQASEASRLYAAWNLMDRPTMLVGVRRLNGESVIRFLGRKFLNFFASILCLKWLPDLNSGMRIFDKKIAMGYRRILCKEFSFTTSLTMSMMCDNYRVEFFPIHVEKRNFGKSKVKVIKHGFITLKYILWIGLALRTRRIREWVRKLRSA